jgi:hypothetical protein
MAIKQGDIVSIKTTGEYVFVLTNPKLGSEFDGNYEQVYIRRPKLTQNGIEHIESRFRVDELETIEEHTEREVKEAYAKLEAQKKLMDAKMKALAVEPDGPKEYFN